MVGNVGVLKGVWGQLGEDPEEEKLQINRGNIIDNHCGSDIQIKPI